MNYKLLPRLDSLDPQVYAKIDDDGISRYSCTADDPELKEWLEEGNTPLPADES